MGEGKGLYVIYDNSYVNSGNVLPETVYSRIASGQGTITLNSIEEYVNMDQHLALKGEYQASLSPTAVAAQVTADNSNQKESTF